MADITLSRIDDDIKDVIQNLYEIQTSTLGYAGPETQRELVQKIQTLTRSLQTLSKDTTPPSDTPQAQSVKDPEDPPLHTISLPPEIIDYVDSSRNPDIYTREFVELVQKSNQDLKGKAEAFESFRDILAKEMVAALPELKGEVERTLGDSVTREVARENGDATIPTAANGTNGNTTTDAEGKNSTETEREG